MIKKGISLFILTAMLVLCMVPMAYAADAGLDNFQRTAVYTQGQFNDVAANAWYAESVKTGYEMGLIKGSSATTYNPTGNITLAEAITLAARLHSIYQTGEANFGQSDPWYKAYTDYATANGIIKSGAYADYSAYATRGQFALIFSAALPDTALGKINNVTVGSLPDVVGNETYGPAVYKLYNAGILAGNDKYGTFKPASNIQRSEVAAIVTRMADKGLRKSFTLEKAPLSPELKEKANAVLSYLNNASGYFDKCIERILSKYHTTALVNTALASGQMKAALEICESEPIFSAVVDSINTIINKLAQFRVYSSGSVELSERIYSTVKECRPILNNISSKIKNLIN